MPRRLLALLLLLALAPSCAGCGGASQSDHPSLIASVPVSGSTVETGITTVRLTFDEPVRLFLPYQVQVFREGFFIPVFVFQLPGESTSVRLRPLSGEAFSPGDYLVYALQGLVLNAAEHYAIDPQAISFRVAGAPWFFVGSPVTDRVSAIDDVTLNTLSSTPTPGGRDPVGLLAQRQGSLPRVFVQLANGGGTGQALAAFFPGSPTMTPITLTTSGGDLAALAPALALEPEGIFLYAAFVDVAAQRVRVTRVRTGDALETGSLLLSLPAAPDTAPTSLTLRSGTSTLLVTAQAAGVGRVAYVDLATFTEIDRDAGTPGTQAALLGGPPGPAALLADATTLLVAPPSAPTADLRLFTLDADTSTLEVGLQPGNPTSVLVGFDGALVFEGLISGPFEEPLVVRASADLTTTTPVDVVDDVGGVDQGTTRVSALAQVPAQTRLYVLLDASCLARYSWDGTNVVQDDLDPLTGGIQVLKLSGSAAGATCIGVVAGSVP